jgi:hypothetical protein
MSNKKQTSIDYLIKEFSDILGKITTTPMQDMLITDAIIKSKSMHKQEIEDAYGDGYDSCHSTGLSAKQYFEQTFKND